VRYTRLFDPYPDVVPTLAALHARGVTIGVCSNWDWDLDRHLTRAGVDGLLDFTVCSARVGTRKPSTQMFATVLDRAGVQPDRVLFVGDSWRDDVEGAAAVGMRRLHLVRAGDCPVTAHADVPCASSLDAVVTSPVDPGRVPRSAAGRDRARASEPDGTTASTPRPTDPEPRPATGAGRLGAAAVVAVDDATRLSPEGVGALSRRTAPPALTLAPLGRRTMSMHRGQPFPPS
jgi:hypothetical protein